MRYCRGHVAAMSRPCRGKVFALNVSQYVSFWVEKPLNMPSCYLKVRTLALWLRLKVLLYDLISVKTSVSRGIISRQAAKARSQNNWPHVISFVKQRLGRDQTAQLADFSRAFRWTGLNFNSFFLRDLFTRQVSAND